MLNVMRRSNLIRAVAKRVVSEKKHLKTIETTYTKTSSRAVF